MPGVEIKREKKAHENGRKMNTKERETKNKGLR